MYYGKYKAIVLKVDETNMEIKVRCSEIFGEYESPWCIPCIPFSDDPNQFMPSVGDNVWIEFQGGKCSSPIWCGTW